MDERDKCGLHGRYGADGDGDDETVKKKSILGAFSRTVLIDIVIWCLYSTVVPANVEMSTCNQISTRGYCT